MVPLYILGLLLRFGPQHGYQIKKLIETELADFTQIKLPNIYYHLEKMKDAGFIDSQTGQDGLRPEKKIYHVTTIGITELQTLLKKELEIGYRPTFHSDALFYFSEHLDAEALVAALKKHVTYLRAALAHIEQHRAAVIPQLPPEIACYADLIFEHHLLHYQAETAWAEKAIHTNQNFSGGLNYDKSKSD